MQDVAEAICANSSAIFQQSCWDTLDISNYLVNSTGWVWTIPRCDPSTMSGMSGIGILTLA